MNTFLVCVLVVAALAIIAVWPFAIAWSLNHVAGLSLAYSWQTWCAVFALTLTVGGAAKS